MVKQEHMKQEPGTQPNVLAAQPNYNGLDNKNSVAANRAAQQLQLQYGMRAAGSINAIQDCMGQQQQQQQQQPQSSSQTQQPTSHETGEPAGLGPTSQSAGTINHVGNGQTDGAGDEDGIEGILLRRGVSGNLHELGRVEIDGILHEQMAIKAKAMEGGGLMVPLKEATGRSPKRYSAGQSQERGRIRRWRRRRRRR